MQLPRITLVTPSYNQAQYLEETIRSIVAQNYPNLEWFVVDGGSTDGSAEIIKGYEQHFAWWVSERDKGQTDALNKGYARATGEIFAFVNSDDTLEPGCLHYVAKHFTPDVNWVVGWAKFFTDDGDEYYYPPKSTGRAVDWLVVNPIPQISSFWRAGAFKEAGPLSQAMHFSFDYEYWLRLYFKLGWRPKIVWRCLGGFRQQAASKTLSQPDRFGVENAGLIEQYAPMLSPDERAKLPGTTKKWRAQEQCREAALALHTGDVPKARKLALAALKSRPLSIEGLRTTYRTFRGR